ncbi:B-type cyclin [Neophaeococcomyces mojaviensis]|uniref:B-type cyclin n=1 Tax=Neophaeococcomyces mojaviensis TaxID=3383035 RepID=A0ACC2ZTM2_9EURO|nr:B-type cyclin [Knufia sp. JES_112]
MRTLRVLNDENCPPEHPLPKTIHQRNKSSPALTTINQMKGNAKRTAFGDVSNIVAIKRTSKDDSNVNSKASHVVTKGGQTLQERKSAINLLRPAQRPLSVTNLKNFLTGSTTEIITKIPLNDSTTIAQQPVNSRKVLSKRNTIIFKDISLDTVQEDGTAEKLEQPQIAVNSELVSLPPLSEIDVTKLDSKLQLPPPISSDIIDPVKLLPPSDISLPGIQEVNLHEHHMSSETEPAYAKNDPVDIYIPTVEQTLEDDQASKTQYVDALPVLPEEVVSAAVVEQPEPISYQNVPQSLQHIYQPTPEPEEYWEEEYDEAYDDDGYVTAKSFRSRGDNTTGGATTMLEPFFSKKIQREIEDAARHVEANRTPEDVEDESFDTSMVAEYGDEIFGYMREQEIRMMPNPHYMNNQHEIQWSMRAVLMDWLVQVHHRFNLLPETLFLCVNYIDRFLSCKVVSLGKLQLVGATAIFIAAKYEEINCPSVQEIVYMVDGGYSVDEILKAERFMLTMLQFELGFPGPMSFLRRISKADDYDLETRTLAKYFLEVTLMDEKFLACPPSFAAAASHYLAQQMLRKGEWSKAHVYYSGYVVSQLRPVAQAILECCEDPRKHHQAVFNKYCDKRYKRASAFVETELQRGFHLPGTFVSRSIFQPPYQPYFAVETYA